MTNLEPTGGGRGASAWNRVEMTRKSRKKARIRARQTRRNVAYSVAARSANAKAAEATETTIEAAVLVIPGRQLGYHGAIYGLQCVAATKRGGRCRNGLHPHGQIAKWDAQSRYRLDWEVEDPYWIERYGSAETLLATFLQQRCKLHVDAIGPDAVPREIYDLGPVEPTPADAFDAIQRRVSPAMAILLSHGVDLSTDPDISAEVAAAHAGDMAPLLGLVERHPLPLDLRPVHVGEPDPNYVHAPIWWVLLDSRMEGVLTDGHLAQCIAVGAPSLVDELG